METAIQQTPDNSTTSTEKPRIAYKPVPTSRLVELRKRGLSYDEIGKLCGITKSAVCHRFAHHGINPDELIDYADSKSVMHEALQYQIQKSVSTTDLKKAPLGSKVLAICQLEDKIRLLRDQSTANIAINQAVTEIDKSLSETRARMQQLAQELGIVDNDGE